MRKLKKFSKKEDQITRLEAGEIFEIVWRDAKDKLRNKLKSQSNFNKEIAEQVSLIYNSHEKTNNLYKAEQENDLLT